MFHEFIVNQRSMFVAKYIDVDKIAATAGYTYKGPAFSMLLPMSGANGQILDKVCKTNKVYLFKKTVGTETYYGLFTNTQNMAAVAAGWQMVGYQAMSYQKNVAVCGGIKGLAKVTEFVYKTNAERLTYAVDPVKVTELQNNNLWSKTDKDLGWAPLDNTGVMFFNKEMNFEEVRVLF